MLWGVCPLAEIVFWMDRVKSLLSATYGMNLILEQAGRSPTFLELQIQCDGPSLEWGLKQTVLLSHLSPAPRVCNFRSPNEPHALEVVRGLACSVSTKCVCIATVQHRQENFAHVVWEFKAKKYPHTWWLPMFRSIYPQSALWDPVLVRSLEWTCPVPPDLAVLEPEVPLPRIHLVEELPTAKWLHGHWFKQGGGVLPSVERILTQKILSRNRVSLICAGSI